MTPDITTSAATAAKLIKSGPQRPTVFRGIQLAVILHRQWHDAADFRWGKAPALEAA
ncbi:hypothetical protein [Sphingomonas hengshuiensis]|uniref:hypothetical protein n=1 Tax=Sphingomonas hengshuiensis TaxID=1609977 RepID=UPI0012B9ACD1|nr:hypothetical protein [Sphingomonas hengshuiensis]